MHRADLEEMAQRLEASGDYRVLRRIKRRETATPIQDGDSKVGIVLDVETTGLDIRKSEVVELAMVPFSFSKDGLILSVGEGLSQLNQPSEPIRREITELTGISDETVAGKKLNVTEIELLAATASIIVAHNAQFDRPFAERVSPLFKEKPWACSMRGVPWRDEGIEGRRLGDLLSRFGMFFDGHRAEEDCLATIELLEVVLPKSGKTGLQALLEKARVPTYLISVVGAPFEKKDVLKARGYRWNVSGSNISRAWSIEVLEDEIEPELAFLEKAIMGKPMNFPIQRITAYERFSLSM